MIFKKAAAAALSLAVIGGAAPAAFRYSPESFITANADEAEAEFTEVTDGGIVFSVYEDHAVVSGYDDTLSGELVIPSEINGIPVTEIGKEAFKGNDLITSAVIPDSVKIIGESAFSACSLLESAKLPDELDSWGIMSFSNCDNLKQVNIPTGVSMIPGSAFARTGLEYVEIPDNITYIGTSAFESCEHLSEAVLPSGITKINSFTFAYSGLTTFTVPDSVTSIDSYAFSGCKKLETFNYPDTLNDFGQNILNNALWLKNRKAEDPLVMINQSVIDGTACEGDVVLPEDTVGIWGISFRNNSTMTSITIPASVKEVGYSSFEDCSALVSVTFLNPECKIYKTPYTISNYRDENSGTPCFNGTIYGYEGSTAQTYAETHGYNFEVIGGSSTTTTTTTSVTTTTEKEIVSTTSSEKTTTAKTTTTSKTTTAETTTTSKTTTSKTTTTAKTTTDDTETPTVSTKKTTTTSTTSADESSTTTKVTTTDTLPTLGDVNSDGMINAVDASKILVFYTALQTGEAEVDEWTFATHDINSDELINAVDASLVLSYYASLAAEPDLTLNDFLNSLDQPVKEFNPEVADRKLLNESGSFCGIAYVGAAGMGYINPEQYNAAYIETVAMSGVTDRFDFYWSIPKENYAQTALGTEIYLIIPSDPEAHVTVTQYDIENDKEGEALYRNDCGAPFVLICNYSDITSDVRISITDNAGTHEAFYPCISMKDGKPSASSENVTVFELVPNIPE